MPAVDDARPEPTARFVILGASNVARGISTIVETARLCNGRNPLEIFTAFGHGRSYGLTTRVAGRTLPAIVQCRLWEELAGRAVQSPLPTSALLTDIGNDILYGVEPLRIAMWIEHCLTLLMNLGARVAMTRLPMDSINSLGEARFRVARSVLFPSCRLELHAALQLAAELDVHISELARTHGAALVEHDRDWYGFDPIHIRMSHWRGAWHRAIEGVHALQLNDHAVPDSAWPRSSLRQWALLKLLAPDIRWICGFEQRREQPALSLQDRTSIWAY